MITRRKFSLAGLLAAFGAAALDPSAVNADTQPPSIPIKKPPRKPEMAYDFTITQREDMYVPVPLWNPDGTMPDPTAVTGAKLSVYDTYGGAQFLDDVSLGSGITVALGTDPSGNTVCLATCHWNPAASIAHGVLTYPKICVGTLNVQAAGIITQPDMPLRITVMPATTVGA